MMGLCFVFFVDFLVILLCINFECLFDFFLILVLDYFQVLCFGNLFFFYYSDYKVNMDDDLVYYYYYVVFLVDV